VSRAPELAGLSLSAGLARGLLAHAHRELPNESCALLAGDHRSGSVRTVYPARNLLTSPYRYEIDPHDLVRIVHTIERRGDELIAIFHSHPEGTAVPSASDVREARYRVVHLVAGLSDGAGVLRAWRIDSRDAYEVPLVVS
jgi:[CysO sulfur-carrier protein]-S-L-cysteine hydrolase